jgi:hypothetical protein
MLWLCWQSGVQHDYGHYIGQWQSLLDGADPWPKDNTYGPLHTVIGFLLPLGSLAPKIFMVGSLLLTNIALVLDLLRERGLSSIQIIYLLAIPTNVLLVGVGVIYGLNDAFVAALLIVAVLLRRRDKFMATGLLVGLAALVKFYPLLLLPFFAVEDHRLRWSVIFTGMVIFCLGLALAIIAWGPGLIEGMIYNSSRPPKLLSIIMAVNSLSVGKGLAHSLTQYNTYIVLFGVGAALLFALKAGLHWLEGAVIGYLVMLTLYKVGHQQFYVPWLFMVASLPFVKTKAADRMAVIFLPAILLLSLYQFGYQFGSDEYGERTGHHWVRSYGGLIAFAVSISSIAACMRDLRSRRRAARGPVSEIPNDQVTNVGSST